MFCCYCGKETEDGAKYCQYCGQYIAAEKKTSVSKKAPKKKCKRALALSGAVLLLLAAAGGWVCTLMQKGEAPEAGGNEMSVLSSGFTDIQIVDEDSAIEAAAEAGIRLGYENAAAELTSYVTTAVDGQQFYRLQQNYQGIPVYGKYVIVVADESGESLSMISYAQDIPEDISLEASIDDAQAAESITEYARNNWAAVYDDMTISPLSDDALVIYDQDMDARLAYCLTVQNGDPYEVIVDAQTAEVLGEKCLMFASESESELKGEIYGLPGNTFPIVQMGPEEYSQYSDLQLNLVESPDIEVYMMHDTHRNIAVQNFDGNPGGSECERPVTSINDIIFGNETIEVAQEPQEAAEYLNAVIQVSDYYKDCFGQEVPFGTLTIAYNTGEGNGATGGSDGASSCIIFSNDASVTDKTLVPHEYTHCVQSVHDAAMGVSDKKYELKICESNAITEGLADTFACFYTGIWDKNDGTFDGDKRVAADPSQYGYPEKITDNADNAEDSSYAHRYATVISHMAYKMYHSGAFDINSKELESIWYTTMITLPSRCTYIQFRICMEEAAERAGCTEEQLEVIAKAFDEAEIYKTITCSRQIYLGVFNKQNHHYDEAEVIIDGYQRGFLGKKTPCHKEFSYMVSGDTNDTKLYMLCELEKGDYTITVIDLADQKQVNFEVQVRKNYSSRNIYVNDFGADYIVSPCAELTVLDRNGDILTDYTLAVSDGESLQFIEDGIIDLPEKNYYRFALAYKTGTVTYNDFFTVRVKADGEDTLTRQTDFLKQVPKVPVSDALCEAVKLPDGSVHCYHIPKIGTAAMNGDPFGEINREIYDRYYDWLQANVYGCIYDYDEPYFINDMEYMSGQHQEVLSVVMYTNQWDVSYGIYNVSALTGETLAADDVLRAYGLSDEEFRTKVKDALTGYLDNHTYGADSSEAIRYAAENTLAEDNINAAVPFVAPDGNLCFFAQEHYLAGGGISDIILDARTGEQILWDLCGEDHSDILRVIKGKLTEEDALLAAYAFWGVNPEDMDDDPDYWAAVKEGTEYINGNEYYSVYLRHAVDENGYSWVTTLDIVYVNAKTGACTQSPC